MTLSGLANLADTLLNQTVAQELQALPAATVANATVVAASPAATLDQFVPSSQTGTAAATAEAAGLFTAAPSSLFTAAANSLLAQSTLSQTNLAVAPLVTPLAFLAQAAAQAAVQVSAFAAAASGIPAAANAINANVAPAPTALPQPGAPATTNTNGTTAIPAAAAAPAPGIASIQAQLQKLNISLAALGLNTTDIQKVDQIASLINDFNPIAYSNLVYQLEALAQNATQRTAQAPTANGNTANSRAAATLPVAGATNAAAATA
jgi:hypothetical protein